MVKIVATQNMPYGSRRYAAGEEFEASEKDARLLVKIGRAAHLHPTRFAQGGEVAVQTTPHVGERGPEIVAPLQYSRRDMTAERPGQTGPAP